jgi:cysteine-rich secretory protein family./putative cell wall binding repeat
MKKFIGLVAVAAFSSIMVLSAWAGTWKQNNVGWWFDNGDGTYPASTWQWIDENNDGVAECYYFDRAGYMLANTSTPDGYQVNASGEWVQNGVVQTQNMSNKNIDIIKTIYENKDIIAKITIAVLSFCIPILINYANSLFSLDPFSFTFEYYDKRVLVMFVKLGKAAIICTLLFLGFTFPIAIIKYIDSNIIHKTDILFFSIISFVLFVSLKFRVVQTLLTKIDKSTEVGDYEILRTFFITFSALSFIAIILSSEYFILVSITIILLSSLYIGSIIFGKNYEKINYSYFYMLLQENSEKIFVFGKVKDKLLCGYKDYKKCDYNEIKLFKEKINEFVNLVNTNGTLQNYTDVKNKILKYIDELSYYDELIRVNEDCVSSIFSTINCYVNCGDFSNILSAMQFENYIDEKMKVIAKKVSFRLINLEDAFNNEFYTNASNISRFSKYNL